MDGRRGFVGSLIAGLLACSAPGCSDSHGGSSAAANAGRGANGAAASGAITPGGYIPRPGTIPLFPGSGTSDAGDPLTNGMLCDYVPGADSKILKPIAECYYDKNDPTKLAATLEQVLECVEGTDSVHIRLTFHPWFVDNTYGETAIGWDAREEAMPMAPMMDPMMPPMMDPMMKGPMGMAKPPKMPKPGMGGHTFMDLVGSDHAEIQLTDANGKLVLQFKLDYISEDSSRPSGYGSLGVTGGEGKVIVGKAAWVVNWMTSFDLNLNERGYGSYTTDSPATDDKYTPNPATPEWDYRVVYEAWIDVEAFGAAGFGGAGIEFVHASPSKASSNTLEVEPGDCPCNHNDPDETCGDTPPPDGGTDNPCLDNDPDTICLDSGVPPPPDRGCVDNDPDTVCIDSGVPPPPPGEPTPFCKEHPDDPACSVD